MDILNDRHCTVAESLTESLKQMQLMRECKLPKKSWKDFKEELNKKETH